MSKFEVEPVVNFQIGLQTVSFVSVHSPPGWCTLRSESVLVSGKDTCVLMCAYRAFLYSLHGKLLGDIQMSVHYNTSLYLVVSRGTR